MKGTILTYSPLLAILAFFTVGLANTSYAQADMVASTAHSSMAMQEPEENKPQENLDYLVNTWSSPVTKEEVKQITSILDFWTEEDKAKYKHDAFRDIWVVNLKDYPDWTLDVSKIDPKRKANGPTEKFTKEQLALVANADYSDHLRFSARFNSTKIETGEVEENVLVSQSMSLVPDVQAAYKGGFDALVNYLKEASKGMVKHVKRDKVGRCRVFFTVTSKGSVTDVKLVETSNYSDVDKAMIKVVKDIPLKWTPAQNGKGKKVDQEFVFTFGIAGC
jgi:TonB family protein